MLELKDYINWNELMKQPRYAGGHEDIMNNLFVGAKVLASYVENDYQGNEGFVYELSDERIVLINDYFGSCSGCDSWENTDDDTAKALINALINNATIVNTKEEAIKYLQNSKDYDWENLKEELIKQLV